MACGPCAKRRANQPRGQTKTVPIQPNKSRDNSAPVQGSRLRDKLRFTGRWLFMKHIDRDVFNSLPTSFTSVLVANIADMAKNARTSRDEAAVAYALTDNVIQRNQAIECQARYEVCRDILIMLGRTNELQSGNE